MNIDELSDPEIRKLIKSKEPTVIIPVGSIEQHGAHLPVSTDSDIVTEIASRLAKKCGFIVFPTISYGISYEHNPLFNASIDSSTLRNFLFDIIHSIRYRLISQSVIILNGHHGNIEALNNLFVIPHKNSSRKLASQLGNRVRMYSYWHFMKHKFDHAGFVETSIMLAISDKVKMEKAEKGFTTKGMRKEKIQRIKKLSTERGGFPKVAKNGVWGDPTSATKKDGQKFLAEIVRNLAKECQS